MKKENFKEKNLTELKEELKKRKEELFQLRMDKALGKLKNLRAIFFKRKEIARIKSLIQEKELL